MCTSLQKCALAATWSSCWRCAWPKPTRRTCALLAVSTKASSCTRAYRTFLQKPLCLCTVKEGYKISKLGVEHMLGYGVVQARGTLSEADAARVAHDVLQVLQECHRQGILYAVSGHTDNTLSAWLFCITAPLPWEACSVSCLCQG